uniref:DUF2254 family protein n=1 Tax=Blastomonas sp. TaxID=1909299 RepID=UPI003593E0F4
ALSPGINDPGTAIDVVGTTLRILADWSSEARKSAQAVAYPHLHVPHISVDDIVIDAFRWIARDAAGHLEVQIRIIRALASLNAFDAPRFGEATRMMAQESLGRARDALESRKDIELLEDVYRQSGLAPVE